MTKEKLQTSRCGKTPDIKHLEVKTCFDYKCKNGSCRLSHLSEWVLQGLNLGGIRTP